MAEYTYRIRIEGTVQGVGFRPFVYSLAKRYGLQGSVANNSDGVEIFVNATSKKLDRFVLDLQLEVPMLASIDSISKTKVETRKFKDFHILASSSQGDRSAKIPPDISICQECEQELFDPSNRRYLYPFISCTHCGVRYSIIYDLPYDRKNTSMKFFKMCKKCETEYADPADRRYHAQPIGCWECGPALELKKNDKVIAEESRVVDRAAKLLKEGNILAIKGVGGYHLVCDATNEDTVKKLRKRKKRPAKPFAVMVKDMEMARQLASISPEEEEVLKSKERPIVICKSRILHPAYKMDIVAPNLSRVGLFLPYTPLHLLLLGKMNRPIVATSANMSDDPICTDRESLEGLKGVYDYILDHNRNIVNGCDDSVVMVVKERQIMLRRSRGYAPASIKLPFRLKKTILAMGANQKNTVAIAFKDQVILSPHIGDLNSVKSVEYYKKNIDTLERIYDFKPEIIAHDKHPNYESTKLAHALGSQYPEQITIAVQHHYAHILSVMAEKGLKEKVLGVSFDGTGYGDDGNLWGGEFLLCDYKGFERIAHFKYFKLLGGARAIREPRRVALSLLFELYGKDVLNMKNPTITSFSKIEIENYLISWQKGLNAPFSSSAGRIFDAVASLTGVCQTMSFEGESGMLLEEFYDASVQGEYRFAYESGMIDILPMISEIINEPDTTTAVSKFFHTLVEMIAVVYEPYHLPLVFSGGVFQNRVLLGLLLERFPEAVIPNDIPPNDGGIALGQIVAAKRAKD